MMSQNEAYWRIKKLRENLRAHTSSAANYGNDKLSKLNLDAAEAVEAITLRAQLRPICPALSGKQIGSVVKNLFDDHLFAQHAVLYLYYALQSPNPSEYNAGAFRTDLCIHSEKPDRKNQPGYRKIARDKCFFYHQIESAVNKWPNLFRITQAEFEPYRILFYLQKRLKLNFSTEEIVLIAKSSLPYYDQEHSQKLAHLKVNGVPILDIMKAFSRIWDAQEYDFLRNIPSEPRSIKRSLRLLYQNGIASQIDGIPLDANNYSNEQYNAIKEKILAECSTTPYDCAQQMFWLFTGYIPPHDYPFTDLQELLIGGKVSLNLYELCHGLLCRLGQELQSTRKSVRFSSCIPKEVYRDIMRARSFFSSKWEDTIEREFIDLYIERSIDPLSIEKDREKALMEFVKTKYDLFQKKSVGVGKKNDTDQENDTDQKNDMAQNADTESKSRRYSRNMYKSFSYAAGRIYKCLVDDCFFFVCSHLYQEVFSMLASLNRSLWSL